MALVFYFKYIFHPSPPLILNWICTGSSKLSMNLFIRSWSTDQPLGLSYSVQSFVFDVGTQGVIQLPVPVHAIKQEPGSHHSSRASVTTLVCQSSSTKGKAGGKGKAVKGSSHKATFDPAQLREFSREVRELLPCGPPPLPSRTVAAASVPTTSGTVHNIVFNYCNKSYSQLIHSSWVKHHMERKWSKLLSATEHVANASGGNAIGHGN